MTDPNIPDPAAQPAAPAAPAPAAAASVAAGDYPGKTLGIVGLILSFLAAIVGLIVSAIALSKSKKAGFKNTPAVVGLVIGILGSLVWIVIWGVVIAGAIAAASYCAEAGPGVWTDGGVTYTCG